MVYKYYSPVDYNFNAIREKYFFFCKVGKQNDPFDTSYSLINSSKLKNDMVRMGKLSPNTENVIKEYGTCSFSKCKNNKTLWSHYAQSYEGFAVGFDETTFESMNIELLARVLYKDVQYVDEMIDCNNPDATFQLKNCEGEIETFQIKDCYSDDIKKLDALFVYLAFVKERKIWGNEEECRMFIAKDFVQKDIKGVKKTEDGYKVPMPKNAMKSIIMGHNMSKENKAELADISKKFGLPLYETEPTTPFNIDIISCHEFD